MSSQIVINETRSVVQVSAPSSVAITESPVSLTIDETQSMVNVNVDSVVSIIEQNAAINVNETSTQLVQIGVMGPQGPAGEDATVSDEAIRTDDVNGTILYKGWAVIGTENTDALWKIAKYTFNGDDLTVEWADGNNNYDNIWNDRLTLNYD